MRGFPKHLNTKEDYLFVKDNFDRELWLPEFQALLDTMRDWVFIRQLEKESDGIVDETHKVVTQFPIVNDGSPVTYAQYELQVIPTAPIFELGFSVQEVESIVGKESV